MITMTVLFSDIVTLLQKGWSVPENRPWIIACVAVSIILALASRAVGRLWKQHQKAAGQKRLGAVYGESNIEVNVSFNGPTYIGFLGEGGGEILRLLFSYR